MHRAPIGTNSYYCLILEGYLDPKDLLPGTRLGQYEVFFSAKSLNHARKLKQWMEWNYHCHLGYPELSEKEFHKRPDSGRIEQAFHRQFPELFSLTGAKTPS